MKTKTKWIGLPAIFALIAIAHPALCRADKTNNTPERVGVYDSRALAYAEFWSESHQAKISQTAKAAKEAKAAGQTNRFNELSSAMKKEQDENHLRVFSTAPVDEVLAGMKDRVAEVQKEARVTRLVSKWDEKTLSSFKPEQRVDVTVLLLRDFKLTDKQKKVVEDLLTKPPLPLEKAQELLREGKL